MDSHPSPDIASLVPEPLARGRVLELRGDLVLVELDEDDGSFLEVELPLEVFSLRDQADLYPVAALTLFLGPVLRAELHRVGQALPGHDIPPA